MRRHPLALGLFSRDKGTRRPMRGFYSATEACRSSHRSRSRSGTSTRRPFRTTRSHHEPLRGSAQAARDPRLPARALHRPRGSTAQGRRRLLARPQEAGGDHGRRHPVPCERLSAIGLSPSAVRNQLLPLRVLFRRYRRLVPVNPTADLDLPAVRSERRKIVSSERAQRLLDALQASERALWATAFYAGLQRGELRALRWEDVDLAGGRIRVERSWDDNEGEIDPKSRAGFRTVPILPILADYLVAEKQRTGGQGLVFGTQAGKHPFTPTNVRRKANLTRKKAGLTAIGLHDARHTAASFFIAAGVNAKALSSYIGP